MDHDHLLEQQKEKEQADQLLRGKLVATINRLVDGAQPDVDFPEEVANLNALLIASNYRQIRDVAGQLDLGRLFTLFNSSPVLVSTNKEEKAVGKQLLTAMSMFLEALPGSDVLLKYYDHVVEGLSLDLHARKEVVELWLKRLVRPVFTSEGQLKAVVASSVVNMNGLLRATIRLLAAEETAIAAAAHDVVVISAKAFRQQFYSPVLLEELRKLKDFKSTDKSKSKSAVNRETIQIRLYEVIVDISTSSQLQLDLMNSAGLLPELVADFEAKLSADPLVALNMLKLMTDLASTPHSLSYLRASTSVLPSVAKRLAPKKETDMEVPEDIFDALLLPGCVNFFIRIAEFDVAVLEQFDGAVIDRLLAMLEHGRANKDRELLILAVDSVAYLAGSKNAGKVYVGETKSKLGTSALAAISAMITEVGNTEVKARALSALASMLEIKDDADPGSKAANLTEKWYRQVEAAGAGLSKIMSILAEPLAELRLPALELLRVLATTAWGQKVLAEYSKPSPAATSTSDTSFLDYLLDRRTEHTAESRQAKYAIVRELVMSPFVRLSFSPEQLLRLRAYYKAGAFGKETEEEVSVAFGAS